MGSTFKKLSSCNDRIISTRNIHFAYVKPVKSIYFGPGLNVRPLLPRGPQTSAKSDERCLTSIPGSPLNSQYLEYCGGHTFIDRFSDYFYFIFRSIASSIWLDRIAWRRDHLLFPYLISAFRSVALPCIWFFLYSMFWRICWCGFIACFPSFLLYWQQLLYSFDTNKLFPRERFSRHSISL